MTTHLSDSNYPTKTIFSTLLLLAILSPTPTLASSNNSTPKKPKLTKGLTISTLFGRKKKKSKSKNNTPKKTKQLAVNNQNQSDTNHNNELEKLQENYKQLQEDLMKKSDELVVTQNLLNDTNDELYTIKDDLKRAQLNLEEMKQYKQDYNELLETNKQLEQTTQSTLDEYNFLQKNYDKQQKDMENNIGELQERLEQEKHNNQQQTKKLNNLQKKIKKLQQHQQTTNSKDNTNHQREHSNFKINILQPHNNHTPKTGHQTTKTTTSLSSFSPLTPDEDDTNWKEAYIKLSKNNDQLFQKKNQEIKKLQNDMFNQELALQQAYQETDYIKQVGLELLEQLEQLKKEEQEKLERQESLKFKKENNNDINNSDNTNHNRDETIQMQFSPRKTTSTGTIIIGGQHQSYKDLTSILQQPSKSSLHSTSPRHRDLNKVRSSIDIHSSTSDLLSPENMVQMTKRLTQSIHSIDLNGLDLEHNSSTTNQSHEYLDVDNHSTTQDYENKLHNMEENHRQELDKLRKDYDTKLKNMQTTLQQEHNKELDKLKNETLSAQQAHEDQVQQLNITHQTTLNNQQQNYKQQILTLQQNFRSEKDPYNSLKTNTTNNNPIEGTTPQKNHITKQKTTTTSQNTMSFPIKFTLGTLIIYAITMTIAYMKKQPKHPSRRHVKKTNNKK